MVLTSSVSPVISLVARSVDVGVTDRLFLWLLGGCVCVCVRERERESVTDRLFLWGLVLLTSVSPKVFLVPDSVNFGVTDRLFLWGLVLLTLVSSNVFSGSSLFLTVCFSGGWVC